ncbi:MAG: peptidoglycan bridge formation glycyltransferase FemA/FemB family protein [Bacilli bacterium]|nr:peptidoglycan bridge formation glycyltransferase FemA/FemB family protein [Bacilli bacterium]
MLLKELTNNEFNSFKNSFNSSSLYQSIAYKNVMEKEGFNTILLGLVDNDNILAASLIIILKSGKIKYGYAPRGFLIDYNNHELLRIFTKEIKKYLSKKNVAAIKLCPNIIKSVNDTKYNIINHNNYYDNIIYNLNSLGYKHLGYNNHFEGLKPRFEAIIDLDSPYYILFKNIKKEYRTKIRSAEKKGINIFKGNINNLNDLYEQIKNKYPRKIEYFNNIYEEFDKDNNVELFYSKLDTKYYLNLIQKKYHKQEEICNYYNSIISGNINEKNISKKMEADKLLNKYKKEIIKATKYLKEYPNGIITSTILIIKNKEEIYMLMDGYDSKFKSFNSKHLLIWKLIEMYSNQGFKKFNLGGITNPNIDSKYKGLNEFKLNFNALCYEYIGDLELVCNETLYFIYKNVPLKGILKI